jgi:hypothetical protein
MGLEDFALTMDELNAAIKSFIDTRCKKGPGYLTHKECGGGIRVGFLNLFYINDDGSLDSGNDGFGIEPKRVPYCERCFPPDGFDYTYAVRFPILRNDSVRKDSNYKFIWGIKELKHKNQTLLLK